MCSIFRIFFRLNRKKTAVKAVNDVSFQIKKGEIFGLVGESGPENLPLHAV